MNWFLSDRADPRALPIADRHYNRQKPGTPAGAWVNSAFRRESGPLASDLIREAIAVTRWRRPEVPALGMITFIDRDKVRHKRDFGRCYRHAGFVEDGETEGGLLAMRLHAERMPEAMAPDSDQLGLEIAS